MTTETEPAADPTVEALRGPWQAVLAWRDGELADLSGLDIDDLDEVEIAIVRDTALPRLDSDGDRQLPDTYNADDLAVSFDGTGCETVDELRALWARAQAMVAGLNAAPNPLAFALAAAFTPDALHDFAEVVGRRVQEPTGAYARLVKALNDAGRLSLQRVEAEGADR